MAAHPRRGRGPQIPGVGAAHRAGGRRPRAVRTVGGQHRRRGGRGRPGRRLMATRRRGDCRFSGLSGFRGDIRLSYLSRIQNRRNFDSWGAASCLVGGQGVAAGRRLGGRQFGNGRGDGQAQGGQGPGRGDDHRRGRGTGDKAGAVDGLPQLLFPVGTGDAGQTVVSIGEVGHADALKGHVNRRGVGPQGAGLPSHGVRGHGRRGDDGHNRGIL